MTYAYVGPDGLGTYDGHVETGEDGPFAMVISPREMPLDVAVAWARRHSREVEVRDASGFADDELDWTTFSGGESSIDGLPEWPGTPAAEPANHGRRDWRVFAKFVAFADDRQAFLDDLVAAIAAHDAADDSMGEIVGGRRIELQFTLREMSEEDAAVAAHDILGAAWHASAVTPGRRDWDVSSVELGPALF